jgi:hypothetical protein
MPSGEVIILLLAPLLATATNNPLPYATACHQLSAAGVLAVQFIPSGELAANPVGTPETFAKPTPTNKPLPKVTYSMLKPVGTVFQVIPSLE